MAVTLRSESLQLALMSDRCRHILTLSSTDSLSFLENAERRTFVNWALIYCLAHKFSFTCLGWFLLEGGNKLIILFCCCCFVLRQGLIMQHRLSLNL
jgi:hypothetical protein